MLKSKKAIELLREIYWEDFEITEEMKTTIQEFLWSLPNEDSEEKIKLIEELKEETTTDWHTVNRKRVNNVIRAFNEWQTVHHFDEHQKDIVLARITALKKWSDEEGSGGLAEWQVDILNEMQDWIDLR